MPVPDPVFQTVQGILPGLYKVVVNKGDDNGIDQDIQVIGYRLALIVNAKLSGSAAYRMTKILGIIE
jgi:hypothetical protein